VGDPNQSIYGWRGASAANLAQFGDQFSRAQPHNSFALTISWRNGKKILDAANTLATPLAHELAVTVPTLDPGPVASAHPVDANVAETLGEEAAYAARWLAERLAEAPADATAAILFRKRTTQREFTRALRAEGVPYHVIGIDGLLAEPEFADLVSALAVVDDPTAGSQLVRLLAGSRWRLAPSDLHALSVVASALTKLSPDGSPLPKD